jgi:microcin C transport system permease protein
VKDYPETQFGGDFPAKTDYLDPYIRAKIESRQFRDLPAEPLPLRHDRLFRVAAVPGAAVREQLARHRPVRPRRARAAAVRISLSVLMAFALTGVAIGVLTGALQGFYGGRIDLVGQRLIEVWSALPELYLLIIFASIFEPSLWLLSSCCRCSAGSCCPTTCAPSSCATARSTT